MTRLLVNLLSLLALGAIVIAVPAPGILPTGSESVVALTTKPAKTLTATATATLSHSPSSTAKISISNDAINSAPVQNKPASDPSLVSIPGNNNSTLVAARPDLQEYVDNAGEFSINKTDESKRDAQIQSDPLMRRTPSADDCIGSIALDQPTWNAIAAKICKIWYPSATTFQYDPSSTWPSFLKSTTLGPVHVGPGLNVNLEFTYGVEDWGLSAAYGWQPFYEPQSQALCIADLTVLINEMVNDNVCLFATGYDTSGVINGVGGVIIPSGTGQPKWYTFSAF